MKIAFPVRANYWVGLEKVITFVSKWETLNGFNGVNGSGQSEWNGCMPLTLAKSLSGFLSLSKKAIFAHKARLSRNARQTVKEKRKKIKSYVINLHQKAPKRSLTLSVLWEPCAVRERGSVTLWLSNGFLMSSLPNRALHNLPQKSFETQSTHLLLLNSRMPSLYHFNTFQHRNVFENESFKKGLRSRPVQRPYLWCHFHRFIMASMASGWPFWSTASDQRSVRLFNACFMAACHNHDIVCQSPPTPITTTNELPKLRN